MITKTYVQLEANLCVIKIFNENPVALNMIKESLTLKTLAYVGMCILDLSKMLMYDSCHNYVRKKFNDEANNYSQTQTR